MVHDIVQTGFSARMRVDLRDAAADEPLVEAGPLRLALRMAGRTPGLERYDRDAGNYLAFPMPDGSCPVVEATLAGLRVGIPLGLLARPDGVHDVEVRVAESHFSIAMDGHVDDDMLSVPSLEADLEALRTLSPRVASLSVSVPAGTDAGGRIPDARPIARSIQYWTPDGHDAWVGDVAPFGADRRILAGWLGFHDEAWWGGWLVLRELVQFPDGTLGTKWVPEIEPPSPPETFAAEPGRPLRVAFPREGSEGPALVFRLDPAARTASFADDVPEPRFGALHSANNVRIGHLPDLGAGAAVRIVRHHDPKGGATIFDAEIGGCRTLVCRRRGRYRAADEKRKPL